MNVWADDDPFLPAMPRGPRVGSWLVLAALLFGVAMAVALHAAR